MAETMRVEAVWGEGMRFDAATGSGHEMVLDAGAEHDGQDQGPRPVEILLAAQAGCTGMDVISILKKMRQPVTGYQVRVTGERRDDFPRIFTKIMVEHILQGDLDEDKVAHAVELSEEKYCSVSAMLREAAQLEVKWTIEK